jgi:hypothetical protein
MQWPDEEAAVVYLPETTSTHLISAAAGLVLHVAGQAPVSLESITHALEAAIGAAEDAEGGASQPANVTLEQTLAIVDGLLEAGLLRACA